MCDVFANDQVFSELQKSMPALLTSPLYLLSPSLTWSETESPVFSHGKSPDTFPPPLLPAPPSPPPHLHPTHTHTHTVHNKTYQLEGPNTAHS